MKKNNPSGYESISDSATSSDSLAMTRTAVGSPKTNPASTLSDIYATRTPSPLELARSALGLDDGKIGLASLAAEFSTTRLGLERTVPATSTLSDIYATRTPSPLEVARSALGLDDGKN